MQFVKFAAGGAVGTGCHFLTLILLVELIGSPVVLGTMAGFTVGAIVNYLIARHIVFESSRPHREALPRYVSVASIGVTLNTALVVALFDAGLQYLVAQLMATIAVLVWNFFANKHWTFLE